MPKYSVVIVPSEDIVSLVADIKQELSEKIGWFHSKNSQAHITLLEIVTTEEEAKKITHTIKNLCDGLKPVRVTFNRFGTFPNGAFFVAPTEDSKIELKSVMKEVHNATKLLKNAYRSHEPHITIGRQLAEENLKTAAETFTTIRFSFTCNSISLRVYNESVKQYEVIEKYFFNNNPKESNEQGKLF